MGEGETSYLVYHGFVYSSDRNLVIRKSLADLLHILSDSTCKVYWVYEVTRREQGETIRKLPLDDLMKGTIEYQKNLFKSSK